MTLLRKHNSIFWLSIAAAVCSLLVVSTFVYSSYLLVSHWQTALEPCVECSKTFFRHAFVPSHIVPLVLLLWSTLGIVRTCLFIKKELAFQVHTQRGHVTNKGSIFLVDNAPLAAWSAGWLHPSICVHTNFWKTLTMAEKKALHAHEKYHVDHLETMSFFLLGYCISILPLPLIADGIRAFLRSKRMTSELAADKQAMRVTSQRTLASLLHKALQFEHGHQVSVAPAMNSFMKQRILHITNREAIPQSNWQTSLLLPTTLLGIGTGIYAVFHFVEPLTGCL